MDEKQKKDLLGKLRQPIHIGYIAKYITRTSEEEALQILNPFIKEGIIEESKLAKSYYGLVGPSGPKK